MNYYNLLMTPAKACNAHYEKFRFLSSSYNKLFLIKLSTLPRLIFLSDIKTEILKLNSCINLFINELGNFDFTRNCPNNFTFYSGVFK